MKPILQGKHIADLRAKRFDVLKFRKLKNWPYKKKTYTEEEVDDYKENRRMRKLARYTPDRINEQISSRWFNKPQIKALVAEYTINRNTHRFNREINNKQALEYIKQKTEHSLYHVNLY